MDVMMKIIDKALELGLDRKVTFVALGGGVIGDMVGFAWCQFHSDPHYRHGHGGLVGRW